MKKPAVAKPKRRVAELPPGAGVQAKAPPTVPEAVLLKYQQAAVADDAQVMIAEKSRRTGFTWGLGAKAVLAAGTRRSDGGMNVFYIAYNQDMTREFIEYCAMWARALGQAAGEIGEELIEDDGKKIHAYHIEFPSGFRIQALSSRPSNLRGKQGLVIIDEAAFHENLRDLIKAALALLMWGGKVIIVSTHDGDDNYFNELIQQVRAGKLTWSLHRLTLDDALAQGLFRQICLVKGNAWSPEAEAAWRAEIFAQYPEREDADEELMCVPRGSGGTYLSRQLIESRAISGHVARLHLPDTFVHLPKGDREKHVREWCEERLGLMFKAFDPKLQHFFGEDFGRSGDQTVIAVGCIERTLKRNVPLTVELRNVPFEQQSQVLFYILDRLPRFSGGKMDARGNGQYLAEVAAQRYGANRIEQVMLSDKWYLDNLPPFKAAFEDGTILIPADADTVNDLRAFRTINGVPKLPKEKTGSSDGKQRHGDAGIALVMFHAASRSDVQEYEFYRAVPQPAGRDGRDGRDRDDDPRRVQATANFKRDGVI